MPRQPESYFAINKRRHMQGGTVSPPTERVIVVRGQPDAERTVDRLLRELDEGEREAGWSYYWKPIPRDEGRAAFQLQERRRRRDY